ncbi:hypothetical protein QYF36_010731 [Acer negundo]|nr:hypothetical protein QYF36_010731 [Acer negundo]
MRNRRLLKINNVQFSDDLEYLSDELRYLKLHGYPLKSLPSSFQPKHLFKLDMCSIDIQYLWKGIKHFKELKTIKLKYSHNPIRTPDFTGSDIPKWFDNWSNATSVEINLSPNWLNDNLIIRVVHLR